MLMTIAYAFTALRYAPTSMMLPPRFVRSPMRVCAQNGAYNCGGVCVHKGESGREGETACAAARFAFHVDSPDVCCRSVFRPLVWILVATQGLTILMARNHYTMDVVIASYVTPLLWHW